MNTWIQVVGTTLIFSGLSACTALNNPDDVNHTAEAVARKHVIDPLYTMSEHESYVCTLSPFNGTPTYRVAVNDPRCGVASYVPRADLRCPGSVPVTTRLHEQTSCGITPPCPTKDYQGNPLVHQGNPRSNGDCGLEGEHSHHPSTSYVRTCTYQVAARPATCACPFGRPEECTDWQVASYHTCRPESIINVERWPACNYILDPEELNCYLEGCGKFPNGIKSRIPVLAATLEVARRDFFRSTADKGGLACHIKRLGCVKKYRAYSDVPRAHYTEIFGPFNGWDWNCRTDQDVDPAGKDCTAPATNAPTNPWPEVPGAPEGCEFLQCLGSPVPSAVRPSASATRPTLSTFRDLDEDQCTAQTGDSALCQAAWLYWGDRLELERIHEQVTLLLADDVLKVAEYQSSYNFGDVKATIDELMRTSVPEVKTEGSTP